MNLTLRNHHRSIQPCPQPRQHFRGGSGEERLQTFSPFTFQHPALFSIDGTQLEAEGRRACVVQPTGVRLWGTGITSTRPNKHTTTFDSAELPYQAVEREQGLPNGIWLRAVFPKVTLFGTYWEILQHLSLILVLETYSAY